MTTVLAGASGIDAIHILSHGGDGALFIGDTRISAPQLDAGPYRTEGATWGRALAPGVDLLVHGCDVAATDVGRAFVRVLAQRTGADVAASTDLTGQARLGGDWSLEYATGPVDAAVNSNAGTGYQYLYSQGDFAGQGSINISLGEASTSVTGDRNVIDAVLLDGDEGALRYAPDAAWVGRDAFLDRVDDGLLASETVLVTIVVRATGTGPEFGGGSPEIVGETPIIVIPPPAGLPPFESSPDWPASTEGPDDGPRTSRPLQGVSETPDPESFADGESPEGQGAPAPPATPGGDATDGDEVTAAPTAPPRGREIPIGARILAIADSFDAMISDRVYRKAIAPDAAIAEIRRCAGTQFDPELVDRFIATIRAEGEGRHELIPPLSMADALKIGLLIEDLAIALDARDHEALGRVASCLGVTADGCRIGPIATLSRTIEAAAAEKADWVGVMVLTGELLDLCRSTQASDLSARAIDDLAYDPADDRPAVDGETGHAPDAPRATRAAAARPREPVRTA